MRGAVPTRITELSVPKSSELLTASGSATQREPLMMKAYSCRPGVRATDTAHTPGAPERLSCVAPLVHALKSPTSWTLLAPESTKTKRTSRTVSRPTGDKAVLEIPDEGVEIRDPIATPDNAMTALIPAARASPVIGDRRNTRSVRHQDTWEERAGYSAGPSIRTLSIRRSSKDGSSFSGVRSSAAIRST